MNLFRNRHGGGITVYYDNNIENELRSEGTVVSDTESYFVSLRICHIMNVFATISCPVIVICRPSNET